MTAIDWAAIQARNLEHTIRPQRGDVWDERFVVQFVVAWTDGEHVEYLDRSIHAKSVDADHWTWDVSAPLVRTTVEEFATRLRYSSPSMNHKTWAQVTPAPNRHDWAVTAALAERARRAP